MRRLALGMVAIASIGALSGCGRSDYQYLQSDDGHLFAKVPRQWNVESEGQVAYSLLTTESNLGLAFTAEDSTTPWRADFDAGSRDGTKPFGWIESQHIDARARDGIGLTDIVTQLGLGGGDMQTKRFTRADGVEGLRVGYWVPRTDQPPIKVEAVFLTDDRNSAVYYGVIGCDEGCVERYQKQIEAVLSTVTVKP